MSREEKNRGRMPQSNWERLRMVICAAVTMAIAIAAIIGCTEIGTENKPENNYGEKKEVRLKVDLKLNGVTERSTKAAINDQLVEDVNVYVTDQIGDVVYHGYHKFQMELKVETYDKMEYRVYAIANAGKKITATCAEDIENLTYSIANSTFIKSDEGAVLMSGKSDPVKLNTTAQVTVFLTRCVAKVVVRADYSQLYEDVKIKVKSIKLRNIPNTINIFGENKIKSSSQSIDGDAAYNLTEEQLKNGISFYQFENLQGTLQPENTSQQQKQWPQGSMYSKICSYIELSATYSSPRQYGDILYRFYLGKDMVSNYDIKRNTQQNITVNFKNDGAVDENTWRVDNSEIIDLVTEINLSPTSMEFTALGESRQITATVYPTYAYKKDLKWSTTNPNVAEVDTNGQVTSIGNGECTIYATSTDGTNIKGACSVKVNEVLPDEPEKPEPPTEPEEPEDPTEPENPTEPEDPEEPEEPENPEEPDDPETPAEPEKDPQLEFAVKEANMYDGQSCTYTFSTVNTEGETITANSSNTAVVKVSGVGESGITVEAVAPGEAVITANIGDDVSTQCMIKVEKLKIQAQESKITTHNHFYADIEYQITPQYAAKDFQVVVTPSAEEVKTGFEGIGNRIIPQFSAEATLPQTSTITLSLSGRTDVATEVELTVNPMLQMTSSMNVNANFGKTTVEKSLGLQMHPRAQVQLSWKEADGVKFYGSPGEGDVEISVEEDKIRFPIPNSANGLYRLEATVKGDDGYGGEESQTDSKQHCDITIYETIYLVGVSKTIDRNKVEGETDTWEYENEIVAKWFSHPNSLMYPQGELDLELGFSYDGKTYTENYTGVTEKFTFTFVKGEKLDMALGTTDETYNGTAPQYYLEYFKLQPASSSHIKGNPATGEPYLYIYSRFFMSGFSKTPSPDWDKIFELIYP